MTRLRQLVSCGSCQRQFDASGHSAGEQFRCLCGELVAIPEIEPRDAAVVRCSSCGGPRQTGQADCHFCGSDFTLHERDLDTLCPGCGARISNSARYCHACSLPIAPEAQIGEITETACPVCDEPWHLTSRRIGRERLALLECGRCAGLWLGSEVFKQLEEKALLRAPVDTTGPAGPASPGPPLRPVDSPRTYRPCPVCGKLMHRRNFGRKSGVILDTCAAHGLWFDPGELETVLTWIREGGSKRAEAATRERRAMPRPDAPPASDGPIVSRSPAGALIDLLGEIGEYLF